MLSSVVSKIAFRNIFRQKRRSVLTGLTMAGGFILLSLAISLSEGTYGNAIDLFTRSHTGHIQVHKKGYFDKPSLYNTIENLSNLGEKIDGVEGVSSWAPRVFSGALAFKGKKTTVARIIGIDPVQEPKTTTIKNKIKEGQFFSDKTNNEVMIAGGLAEVLKAKVNDEIILISQAADGSIANDIFKVAAIMKGTTSSFDRANCYMHVKTAQEFLYLHDRYHEIALVIEDYRESREKAQDLKMAVANDAFRVEPWQVIQKHFYDAMTADKKGMWYALFIIIVIVGLGVLNTVLMAVLERTREFGMLKALGTRPWDIFSMILFETVFLSIISISVGFVLSFILNSILTVKGIPYPTTIHIGGFEISHMIGTTVPITYVYPSLVTFLTAVLVSLMPAARAMRILPMKAMRIH